MIPAILEEIFKLENFLPHVLFCNALLYKAVSKCSLLAKVFMANIFLCCPTFCSVHGRFSFVACPSLIYVAFDCFCHAVMLYVYMHHRCMSEAQISMPLPYVLPMELNALHKCYSLITCFGNHNGFIAYPVYRISNRLKLSGILYLKHSWCILVFFLPFSIFYAAFTHYIIFFSTRMSNTSSKHSVISPQLLSTCCTSTSIAILMKILIHSIA